MDYHHHAVGIYPNATEKPRNLTVMGNFQQAGNHKIKRNLYFDGNQGA
jgi:hypothetical protein